MSSKIFFVAIFFVFASCKIRTYEYALISDRDGQLDLYASFSKDSLVNITNDKTTDYGIKWSPDGNYILFCKIQKNKGDLYLYNVLSKSTEQLTNDTINQYGPSFSPDGKRILFVSDMNHKQNEIYLMELATRRIKRITNNDRLDGSPAFHPDGVRIYYTSFMDKDSLNKITNSEIFVTDTGGSYHSRITNRTGNDGAIDISPDGKIIACHYFQNGKADIYTMNLDGSEIKQLTTDTLDNRWPRWTPDGKRLAYTRVSDNSDIWIMKKNGSGKMPYVISPGRDEILEFNPGKRLN